jgi:hypothetical protein
LQEQGLRNPDSPTIPNVNVDLTLTHEGSSTVGSQFERRSHHSGAQGNGVYVFARRHSAYNASLLPMPSNQQYYSGQRRREHADRYYNSDGDFSDDGGQSVTSALSGAYSADGFNTSKMMRSGTHSFNYHGSHPSVYNVPPSFYGPPANWAGSNSGMSERQYRPYGFGSQYVNPGWAVGTGMSERSYRHNGGGSNYGGSNHHYGNLANVYPDRQIKQNVLVGESLKKPLLEDHV